MASVTDGVAIGCLSPDKSLAIPQRPQSRISLRLILFKGSLRHRLASHPPPQGWAVFPANLIKLGFRSETKMSITFWRWLISDDTSSMTELDRQYFWQYLNGVWRLRSHDTE